MKRTRTRRNILAGLGAAITAAPAVQDGFDPIYSRIEWYDAATAAFKAALAKKSEQPAASAAAELDEAFEELTATTPTSLAGIAAALACVDDIDTSVHGIHEDGRYSELLLDFIGNLREAIERLATEGGVTG